MDKKELENEIMKTQKQLEALQKKLKEAENEVPETLDFKLGDDLFVTDIEGSVRDFIYDGSGWDIRICKHHRAFPSEKYAKKFADKTQFIADMLHFKYLYDRDYEPDWSNFYEKKYFVFYDCSDHKYYYEVRHSLWDPTNIYFSTKEIAQKCADWLNKKHN